MFSTRVLALLFAFLALISATPIHFERRAPRSGFRGATKSTDGRFFYLYSGPHFWKYDIAADKTVAGYPKVITEEFPNLPAGFEGDFDAAFTLGDTDYFFKGSQFIQGPLTDPDSEPQIQAISSKWVDFPFRSIDVAVSWPSMGQTYFFSGDSYIRYDEVTQKMDRTPGLIASQWHGLGPLISSHGALDGAVFYDAHTVYFFAGSKFVKYDPVADMTPEGYPADIASGITDTVLAEQDGRGMKVAPAVKGWTGLVPVDPEMWPGWGWPDAHKERWNEEALSIDDAAYETLEIGTEFKIVQLADMHLSTVNNGRVCGSPKPGHEQTCSDDDTIDFVGRMLDAEKPDLVVFSGDNINGQTAVDPESIIKRYTSNCIARSIPWIHIFGNHDDEDNLSQPQILANRLHLFQTGQKLPLSLTHKGPRGVDGIGNGYITLTHNGKVAARIWYLDSGSYKPWGGYAYLMPSQIKWYKQASKKLDTSPADLTFFHIPTKDWKHVHKKVGAQNEGVSAQGKKNGIVEVMNGKKGLQVAVSGHDHINDFCGVNGKVNLCFGGGIGYGQAYGSTSPAPYFDKRSRVFKFTVVSEGETLVETWKRLDDAALTVVDVQTLGTGSAALTQSTPPHEGLRI